MTRLILILALIVLASPAAAVDDRLTAQAPAKLDHVIVPPAADFEVIRQGGDTVADATVIDAVPYDVVGTTAGYSHDYDEECPYDSMSPDVVYTFTPTGNTSVEIDLCGSAYDTKVYVYDADLNLVACNDDYYFDDECGEYVSYLTGVQMSGGMQYFIVVDGYGGAYGDYILSIAEFEPCDIVCPPEGFLEGEPDLVDGYWDEYNSGCSGPGPPYLAFQSLNFGPSFLDFCGVTGWFIYEGSSFRDTDWFTAVVGENGFIDVTADAESSTYVFELVIPPDCSASVLQNILVGPCSPGTFTIFGAPGEVVFLWAGSSNFQNPGDVEGNMYDYVMTIDGLEGTATETHTWSQVKGLYR